LKDENFKSTQIKQQKCIVTRKIADEMKLKSWITDKFMELFDKINKILGSPND
jgi:hypothetical protein